MQVAEPRTRRWTRAEYYNRILNLLDRQLEIRRDPRPDPSQPYGFGYGDVRIVTAADSVSPVAVPHATIAVRDLLP